MTDTGTMSAQPGLISGLWVVDSRRRSEGEFENRKDCFRTKEEAVARAEAQLDAGWRVAVSHEAWLPDWTMGSDPWVSGGPNDRN